MDLQSIVADLLEGGMTQVEISAACGCAQSTISAIYRGENKNPGYVLGRALEGLRQQQQPKRRKAPAMAGRADGL